MRPLADEPVLFRMRRYIETHYMESEFSFKNMASDFSMSESGLSNYFKKHCGQSLMDYLTGLRIRQAINLLDNTNRTSERWWDISTRILSSAALNN